MNKTVEGDDFVGSGDNLDRLLNGFLSRNSERSDPNYELDPVDLNATPSERFVQILRDSTQLSPEYVAEKVEESEEVEFSESNTNSGLLLLAENYDKTARKQLARGRLFNFSAGALLLAATLLFSALAGYLWFGLGSVVIAAILIVAGRSATKQAQEIQDIARALTHPEVSP